MQKGFNTYVFYNTWFVNLCNFDGIYWYISRLFDLGVVWNDNRRVFNFKRANKAWIKK